jgi:hypothetical protein
LGNLRVQARQFYGPRWRETKIFRFPFCLTLKLKFKHSIWKYRGKDDAALLGARNDCYFFDVAGVGATGRSNPGAEYSQGWDLEVSTE